MKIMIEVSGGSVTNVTATQECSIYLIDHDSLKEREDDESLEGAKQAEYIKASYHCPYCGSDDLDARGAEFDDNYCTRSIQCCSCKKEWTDIYRLVEIEEEN
jgi:formate dehydrogenase maturation protein FdhE